MIRRAYMQCPECEYELLIEDNIKIIFCQNCKTKDGKFKQVKPKSMKTENGIYQQKEYNQNTQEVWRQS